MLRAINQVLSYFDLHLERTVSYGLKYSKPNTKFVVLSILAYAAFGWFSLLLLSVNHELGERAAQCALGAVASQRAAWLFIAALIIFFLYLLRPEIGGLTTRIPARWERAFWRLAMFLAYIWSGLFLAVGGVLLGISLHLVWLEQSSTTVFLALFGVMTLVVGIAYKTQSPEVLWRIRKARKHPLVDVLVPIVSILALTAMILVSAFTPIPRMLTAPTKTPCPDIHVHWR